MFDEPISSDWRKLTVNYHSIAQLAHFAQQTERESKREKDKRHTPQQCVIKQTISSAVRVVISQKSNLCAITTAFLTRRLSLENCTRCIHLMAFANCYDNKVNRMPTLWRPQSAIRLSSRAQISNQIFAYDIF